MVYFFCHFVLDDLLVHAATYPVSIRIGELVHAELSQIWEFVAIFSSRHAVGRRARPSVGRGGADRADCV